MQEMKNKMYTLARVLKLKAPIILLIVYISFLAFVRGKETLKPFA
jgi:uncharacterized membrane protein